MTRKLRVVLADDERPARRFLVNLLRSFPDVEVVGEAGNGKEAIDLIESERPDLALLDLHMPETGGLDVARLVKAGATPSVAFVTAHDDFAIQAFELNASFIADWSPEKWCLHAFHRNQTGFRSLAPPHDGLVGSGQGGYGQVIGQWSFVCGQWYEGPRTTDYGPRIISP